MKEVPLLLEYISWTFWPFHHPIRVSIDKLQHFSVLYREKKIWFDTSL